MEEAHALTSSPTASQFLDFSAADEAGLFDEPLLSTSSDPAVIAAAIDASDTAAVVAATIDCCYDFSMDPAALSAFLDAQSPDPEPDGLIQQSQYDQLVSEVFPTEYSVAAMMPRIYEEACLLPTCAFVDPGIGVQMYQGGVGGVEGQGVVFPAMVGPVAAGLGFQEVPEYQSRTTAAAAMGMCYGMEQLQHVYATSSAELQVFGEMQQQLLRTCRSPTPVTEISSSLEDSACKVGRLSAEERKEKIHRYMKKRNERNFTKKIKYACRKTLADSRPRVRGRFAKNEESETARPNSHNIYDDDDLQVMVKEEDLFDSSDILAHISGVNSFKCNYTLESWI